MAKSQSPVKTPSRRKTANISSVLMDALDERSAEEAIPVATVVRQAIARYVNAAHANALPTMDLDGIEDDVRRGRGPAGQWPVQVSYVLDETLSGQVVEIAEERGVAFNDIIREAICLTLVTNAFPVGAPTRLNHGFVTHDGSASADPSERVVVRVLNQIRK